MRSMWNNWRQIGWQKTPQFPAIPDTFHAIEKKKQQQKTKTKTKRKKKQTKQTKIPQQKF